MAETSPAETACAYRILRYTPNLVRDEWINIGVLLYDPRKRQGQPRLRLIEEPEEFARVRRLHPEADERLLRALRDDFERQFAAGNGGWQQALEKLDDTLSNALQLAPQKGVLAEDLDAELERLYADHVAPPRRAGRPEAAGSRGAIRSYCNQVWRQARVWERIQRSLPIDEYTFAGDPMKLDYGYRRNGTRGFVQAISVTRAPGDAKLLAYTAGRIRAKVASEFAAVTDVPLARENERHRFVAETLGDVGIEAVPLEGFAAWVGKLRTQIQ